MRRSRKGRASSQLIYDEATRCYFFSPAVQFCTSVIGEPVSVIQAFTPLAAYYYSKGPVDHLACDFSTD
jgi:hypothetical protein